MPHLYSDLFIVHELDSEPGPKLKSVYAKAIEHGFTQMDEDMLVVARDMKYNPNYGDEALLKNLRTGEEYFHLMLELSKGKKLISRELENIGMQASSMIERHFPFVRDSELQAIRYFNYTNIDCKMAIDVLQEDKSYDIKVTERSLSDYGQVARALRTDFQQAFYLLGRQISNPDTFQMNPALLVYSIKDDACCEFKMTQQDLSIGRWGATRISPPLVCMDQIIHSSSRIFGFEDGLKKFRAGSPVRDSKGYAELTIW